MYIVSYVTDKLAMLKSRRANSLAADHSPCADKQRTICVCVCVLWILLHAVRESGRLSCKAAQQSFISHQLKIKSIKYQPFIGS